MSKRIVSELLIFLVAWICTTYFGIIPLTLHQYSQYEDQTVFHTEESYKEFKEDIKSRVIEVDLDILQFDIIASEPPIIVKYSIKTPWNYSFPYGEEVQHKFDWVIISLLSLLVGGILFLLTLVFSLLLFGSADEET